MRWWRGPENLREAQADREFAASERKKNETDHELDLPGSLLDVWVDESVGHCDGGGERGDDGRDWWVRIWTVGKREGEQKKQEESEVNWGQRN